MDEKERLAALEVESRTLRETIRDLRDKLENLRQEKADKGTTKPLQIICPLEENMVQDHEKRIRWLERKILIWIGAGAIALVLVQHFWK